MGVKNLVKVNHSDLVSFLAAAVISLVTFVLFLETNQFNYQVNTGLLCAVFCLLPFFMRRFNLIVLPASLVLMIVASIFLHAYGVLLLQYDAIVYWDTVTHTTSSLTVALCVFFTLLMISTYDPRMNITPSSMIFFVFIITMAMGVYWEVLEITADELVGTNMQYSPWDTIRDLTCDFIGGLTISVYAYFYMKNHGGEDLVESLKIHPRLKSFMHMSSRSDHGPDKA